MIKGYAISGEGRKLVLLGISRENTNRLHDGKPIHVMAGELSDDLDGIEILLFAGDTEESMALDLAELIGPDTELIQR